MECTARIHTISKEIGLPLRVQSQSFQLGGSPYLWLRSLPAGEDFLHILGMCVPLAGPRFPARSSHLQLLPLDMLSYVEVSSVHGCRNSTPRLAPNMLNCSFAGYSVGCPQPPLAWEMPTGRSRTKQLLPPVAAPIRFKADSEERSTGVNMWQKNCPVCQKPLEKKHPTETVSCPCGKYVWKG